MGTAFHTKEIASEKSREIQTNLPVDTTPETNSCRAKVTAISDNSDGIYIHCKPGCGSEWNILDLKKNHSNFDNLRNQLQVGIECNFIVRYEHHRPYVWEYSIHVVDIQDCVMCQDDKH